METSDSLNKTEVIKALKEADWPYYAGYPTLADIEKHAASQRELAEKNKAAVGEVLSYGFSENLCRQMKRETELRALGWTNPDSIVSPLLKLHRLYQSDGVRPKQIPLEVIKEVEREIFQQMVRKVAGRQNNPVNMEQWRVDLYGSTDQTIKVDESFEPFTPSLSLLFERVDRPTP